MPAQNVGSEERSLILKRRKQRNLGARRMQSELQREHQMSLSMDTIHKVLTNASAKSLIRPPRKTECIRYAKAIPDERVQMDTCKVRLATINSLPLMISPDIQFWRFSLGEQQVMPRSFLSKSSKRRCFPYNASRPIEDENSLPLAFRNGCGRTASSSDRLNRVRRI